jgi:hypothetical protein
MKYAQVRRKYICACLTDISLSSALKQKMRGQKMNGFHHDDGTEINPDLIVKPDLCISCKNNEDPSQDTICVLTRADQIGKNNFKCEAFKAKK